MTLHNLSSFGKLFIETSLLPHTTYYKKKFTQKRMGWDKNNKFTSTNWLISRCAVGKKMHLNTGTCTKNNAPFPGYHSLKTQNRKHFINYSNKFS